MILSALLLAGIYSFGADQGDSAERELNEQMYAVIFAKPLKAEGATTDQQFCDILQKISDRFEARWKRPLPLLIEFAALQRLRSSTKDLSSFFGLVLHDVPLTEMLRDWCGRAELSYSIKHGTVIIVPAKEK